jgi:hypothetical protein
MLIDILDGILLYIRSNSKFAIEDDIKGSLPEKEKHYYERAIMFLEKEGYVFSKDNTIGGKIIKMTYISFEGLLFLEKGGYRAAFENANQQAQRIKTLEYRQSQMANRLFWINIAITIGTGVAALWYLRELLKP